MKIKRYIISVSHRDETQKYWCESQVKKAIVSVEENEMIHDAIRRAVTEVDYCTFSYNGKPQGNVYQDRKDGSHYVCGYYYRTKHYIEDRSENISKDNVPFTTWVTIHGELIEPTLEDIEN